MSPVRGRWSSYFREDARYVLPSQSHISESVPKYHLTLAGQSPLYAVWCGLLEAKSFHPLSCAEEALVKFPGQWAEWPHPKTVTVTPETVQACRLGLCSAFSACVEMQDEASRSPRMARAVYLRTGRLPFLGLGCWKGREPLRKTAAEMCGRADRGKVSQLQLFHIFPHVHPSLPSGVRSAPSTLR